MRRRKNRGRPFQLGRRPDPDDPSLPPLILPLPEKARRRRRLRRLLGLSVIAAGVGGVAWTLGPAGSGDAATGAAGTDPSPPTELARPSPEEPPPGAASESGQAAPEPSSVSGFGGLAESLRAAIERYRQRHGDFERGRIGCDLLAAGYARVSDAVVELARVPASRERIPVTGGEDPFLSLMQEAAETDRLFEASGCPRP